MIFTTSRNEIRQSIVRSELRMNLLRICSRQPRTIHDLIHAPSYPGIVTSLFTIQSEIGVTIELGECKNRELLVRVGHVPHPTVPHGHTELLRTSLLAFLLTPELAYAEPEAYALYLDAWFASLAAREDPDPKEGEAHALLLAFPELAHRLWYVSGPSAERCAELPFDLTESEWIRVFNLYHLADLPTRSVPLALREWLAAVRRPPLAQGWTRLREHGWSHLKDWKARCSLRALHLLRRRPINGKPVPYTISRLVGPELMENRLQPFRLL